MAEGTRFKTGYLAPSVSYAQIGKEMGESIRLSLQDIYDRQEQRKARLNATYGLTKALDESVPAGIAAKYRDGGQILLREMQEASTRAYQTQNQSDVDEYLRLKGEFIQFRNVASAKSAMDTQTRNSIASGSFQNLSGSVEENLQLYNEYNKAEYTWNPTTKSLEVKVGDSYMPWQQSNIGNMDEVFMPQTLWAGTDYMPENVGADIYESLLSGKEDILQVRDKGYAIGQIDSEAAYSLISKDLQSRLRIRTPEMLEAIQAVAYKAINRPHSTELSQADIAAAAQLYNGEVMFETALPDGRNMASGKLNAEGEWVFDVSDDELSKLMGGDSEYADTRNALKVYLEASAERAYNLIKVQEETAALRRQNLSEIPEVEEPEPEQQYSPLEPFTGPLSVESGDVEGDIVSMPDAYKIKASVPGRSYKMVISGRALRVAADAQGNEVDETTMPAGDIKVEVENLIYGPNGDLVGFDLATGPGILEGVLLDLDGTPIKSVQINRQNDPEAFEEVETTILQVAAPSKNKRSGAQLLYDSRRRILDEYKIEDTQDPMVKESIEAQSAFTQMLTAQFGQKYAENLNNAIGNHPYNERAALRLRIFEDVMEGTYPKIDGDGFVVFE